MAAGVQLVEIFSSVQGEGTHVGETTLFIRFGECDLRCRWCDSPETWLPRRRCRIEEERGSAPLPRARQSGAGVRRGRRGAPTRAWSAIASSSLTGGEPLLQPDAVRALARALRRWARASTWRPTAWPSDALAQVIDGIDVVAMDWKLASDVRRASDAKGAGPTASTSSTPPSCASRGGRPSTS